MEKKKCTKCEVVKEIGDFHKRKSSSDGRDSYCKKCKSYIDKKYREENKEMIAVKKKKYRQENAKKIKQWFIENADYIKEKKKEYNANNKDKIRKSRQRYHKENREIQLKRSRKWKIDNRDKVREYKLKRYHNDLQYKLSEILRSRVNGILCSKYRGGSAVKDLGCSVKEFIEYMESKFYNHPDTGEKMSWKNHSSDGWHIDHIMPLTSFDLSDRKQFLRACHYTNLQPLWAEENYKKGDKI